MQRTGTIFDIKHFAVHDGPGIRTTVFLKGCPLSCLWCHNPESISRQPQLLFTPRKCIGCGYCVDTCPRGAHKLVDGRHVIDRESCAACGACAEGCYAGALEMAGRQVAVDEVMDEVLRDRTFHTNSGGGMTLSGGEPLAQRGFSLALLRAAKTEGLHTALDTSGFAPWELLEELLPHTDLVLYDLKHMDPERHAALTGVPNELILDNLCRLDSTGSPIWIRIPLIPGQNDDDPNYHSLGELLSHLENVDRVEILKYHRLAESKYESAGMEYALKGLVPPSSEELESRRQILMNHGLKESLLR
ncbi:MAG: glycyl-radical enzyme activating protein [Candidatus Bathyarchaeota archaeon]|nr:MAG: glycyl-radical enzyme activating protein [Candidatus Bathyarchaeota archaeon]